VILLISCIVIGAGLGYLLEGRRDKISGTLVGVIIGIVVGIGVGFILDVTLPYETHEFESERVELVALGDTNLLHGTFFLGSGQINSDMYYLFFFKAPDGGKKFDKVNAKNTTVYEEDRSDAYLVRIGQQEQRPNSTYLWLLPKFLVHDVYNYYYAIHVPKGTIKTGYNLDLN
jgi:hypothetical protein